jgi:hypothetical protein
MYKDYAIKILTVLVMIFMTVALYLYLRYSRQEKLLEQKNSVIKEQNAVIEYRTNELGKVIADKNAAEISYKELRESYPKLAESITRDFDIKLKNLKVYMEAEFKASGKGNSTVNNHYYTDSTGVRVPFWKLKASDGYLDLLATVYDSTNAPFKYDYSDTIKYAFNVKKKWFLGNETLYGSGMLSNPNAKINNSTSILIKDFRDKRWSLGPYVGVMPYYDDKLSFRFSVGVGLQYSVFKF